MIVVLKHGAEPDKREQLIGWLKNQGLGVHVSEGAYQTVLGLIGDTARVDMDLIESLSIVDSVKRVTEPFKCCNRKFHPDDMIVQVGDVKVGGGNFWRGRTSEAIERTKADQIGMLATVMNCLAVADVCEQKGIPVRVQTAIEMRAVAEPYIRSRAIRHLEKGRVVIFACGTGNPFFSTDTAAALRAAEINADAILLAKNIDGIYDSDPAKNPQAKKIESIKYTDVLKNRLQVMDSTATSLSMDNNIPVLVFAIKDPENILKVLKGEHIGSVIGEE